MGPPPPGFDEVDDAVAWGMERAKGVVVRTLGGAYYLAGQRPADWGHDIAFRRWPPSVAERGEIDRVYAASTTEALEELAAVEAFEAARAQWLAGHSPTLAADGPVHECLIGDGDEDGWIYFEELSADGDVCAARSPHVGHCFGAARDVIAEAADLPPEDPWVTAVVTALERERTWREGRRSTLQVVRGGGELFHATAAQNRDSIAAHGLDWRRMTGPGIAGSQEPELPAVFLCENLEETSFFTNMSRVPTDVWAVRVDGCWLETGPQGWVILPEPVPADRVRLVATDIPSGRHR